MLKRILSLLLLTLAMGFASAGEITLLEEAAEFEALNVRVSDKGHGKFRLQPCDDCAEVELKISASTTLTVGGKRQPLNALNKYTLRSGTVFYRSKSGQVTRIQAAR